MADEIAERPGTGGGPGKGTVRYHDEADGSYAMAEASHLRFWNTSTLLWERATGSAGALATSGGGGGGGGPVTIADGADVAEGTTSDVAWVSGSGTVISLLKKIASAGGSAVSIADGADVAQGTTTDTAAASTVIGLLKNIKAALAGTLSTARTWTLSSGTDSVDTELPAAAALADGAANPTTPTVGAAMLGIASGLWYRITAAQPNFDGVAGTSIGLLTAAFAHVWNGTGWDRLKGDTTSGAWVNVKNASIPVTDNAGSLTVDAPVATPVAARLSDGAAFLTTASGRLAVDASGVAVPVTDNAGSITVDAPVGTPLFARLSDGAAVLIGQKAMAASLPVTLASDQSALAVTMATQTPDVSDRAAREVGRVRIWDGTDEATVTPIRTLPASSDKTLNVREIPNRLSTFAVAIATQTPTITIGVKELLALWHASTGAKDVYIVEIWASTIITTASTAGRTTIRVSNITTAPTGGTELTKLDVVQGGTTDLTNAMQVKTGGGAVGTTFIRKITTFATNPVGRLDIPVFGASNPANGIILPAGSNAGITIDIEREVAHTALVDLWTVGARWLEI